MIRRKFKQLLATDIGGEDHLLWAIPPIDQIQKPFLILDDQMVALWLILSEFDHYCSN